MLQSLCMTHAGLAIAEGSRVQYGSGQSGRAAHHASKCPVFSHHELTEQSLCM